MQHEMQTARSTEVSNRDSSGRNPNILRGAEAVRLPAALLLPGLVFSVIGSSALLLSGWEAPGSGKCCLHQPRCQSRGEKDLERELEERKEI